MAEAGETATPEGTQYVVFYTEDGAGWTRVEGTFQASGQDAAKSNAAEQTGISGTYFAVPLTSFKPETFVIPERPKPIKAKPTEA